MKKILCLVLLAVVATLFSAPRSVAQVDAPAVDWKPYESGFERDETIHRSGTFAPRLSNAVGSDKRGALWAYNIHQAKALPIVITGWSRADKVDGPPNADYAIYIDLEYADGGSGFGTAAPFDTGTHDWQQRRIILTPDRPIKTLLIYGLLRGHSGTAWFDDFKVEERTGAGFFDSQPLTPPLLPARGVSGWFVRDVAAGGKILPIVPGGAATDGLSLSKVTREQSGAISKTKLKANGTRNRAITLYYVERYDAARPVWWSTLRESRAVSDIEGVNAVSAGEAGATGTQTKYPFGCVTAGGGVSGRAFAIPPDLGPRICRIGYHPGAHVLYIAFDLALMPDRGPAEVAVAHYDVDRNWGFRDAARIYYALFPTYYERRTKQDGIWLPFTDTARIENIRDFGIRWHELNWADAPRNIPEDDKLGILSFRYVEPMSFWMPMPPEMPRDYDTALAYLKKLASGEEKIRTKSDPDTQDLERQSEAHFQALATLVSGSRSPDGRYNVQFQNTPWCNGAVWTLDPNPKMPGPWNKARVNFDPAEADRRYSKDTDGGLDGEYLDSMEGWADVLDYGDISLHRSAAPPTFDTSSFRPVLPTWFSVWEYTSYLRADLRKRGKLIMGNSTPWSIYAFSSLVDAAGTETSWLGGDGAFHPESDAFMCWRRTLSGRKPYLLLMNLDFDKFPSGYVEKYFARCLFYGVFPSFFSVNAADKPYWESAKWYNRDRNLFKKYIPVIKTVSEAGWEPVTAVRSDNPSVWVERYGARYLTLLNTTDAPVQTRLTIDLAAFPPSTKGAALLTDVLDPSAEAQMIETKSDKTGIVTITLQPSETRVVQFATK